MLYRVLKRLVSGGMSPEMREKIDAFYALGRLTRQEYEALTGGDK